MSYRIAASALLLFLGAITPVHAQGAHAKVASAPGPDAYAVPASEVAAVRAATEKYRDIDVALAEGYVEHPVCMVASMEGVPHQVGGMGYHYFRPDMLGITGDQPRVTGTGTHTDFMKPSILLYEPEADGSLKLVAIENLVFAKAWKEAGHDAPPEFHGNQYYLTIDNPATEVDEAHGFEPHYELHWWLYRDNPSGTFSPWNPTVSCGAAEGHAAR